MLVTKCIRCALELCSSIGLVRRVGFKKVLGVSTPNLFQEYQILEKEKHTTNQIKEHNIIES
jgi:hypothetical protein